jgi:hypothetical protein
MVVASTFTGAAACTAAFMPSAALATTQQPARPDINVSVGCNGAGVSHWLHFKASNHTSRCYGGKPFPYNYTNSLSFVQTGYCGGNNVGTYWGYDPKYKSINFHQGTTYGYAGIFRVTSLYMSYWSGTDKCQRAY